MRSRLGTPEVLIWLLCGSSSLNPFPTALDSPRKESPLLFVNPMGLYYVKVELLAHRTANLLFQKVYCNPDSSIRRAPGMTLVTSAMVANRRRSIPLLLMLSTGLIQASELNLAPLPATHETSAPAVGAIEQPSANEGYLLLLTVKPDPSLAYGGYVHDCLYTRFCYQSVLSTTSRPVRKSHCSMRNSYGSMREIDGLNAGPAGA